jgi:hypothetical protein
LAATGERAIGKLASLVAERCHPEMKKTGGGNPG